MSEKERGTDVSDMKKIYRTPNEEEFPDNVQINLKKVLNLRYGENPNQPARVYESEDNELAKLTNISLVKTGKGGLSATNYMDVTRAMDVLKFFGDKPSVAVMKHLIPSGFATQFNGNGLAEMFMNARDADARSAYGSVVVSNVPIDKETAEAIMSGYAEVVAAPGYEEGSMGIFNQKKDIRIATFENLDKIPKFIDDNIDGMYDVKFLPSGRVIVQKPYLTSIRGGEDLVLDPMVIKDEVRYVVERDPTANELDDLLTSWYVNIGTRSNGIVFVKDGVTVAVGSGQQERVGAVEQGAVKSFQKAMDREGLEYKALEGIRDWGHYSNLEQCENPLKGAVMSSDAFFPFRDSIDTVAELGVKAVIQPGGSIRDHQIIQAINEQEMAMVYTLERCFAHF